MREFKPRHTLTTILTSLIIAAGLVACGGGSGDSGGGGGSTSSITGYFIDSAVSGLTYNCSSGASGITGVNGEYTCNQGDTVEFSINGFVVGSVTAASIVTPNDLSTNSAVVLNIAQLLQTLDIDGNPANGIGIPQSGTAYAVMATMTVSMADPNFDTTVGTAIGTPLVAEATAQAHLDASVAAINAVNAAAIQTALAGQTLYPTTAHALLSSTLNVSADGTTFTNTGTDTCGAWSDSGTVSYTDNSIVLSTSRSSVSIRVLAIDPTYIEFAQFGKAYYNQADALNNIDMRRLFAGGKFYPGQISRDYSEEWAFTNDGTNAAIAGIDINGPYAAAGPLTYTSTTFSFATTTFTITGFGNASMCKIVTNNGVFYHTQEDAYVANGL